MKKGGKYARTKGHNFERKIARELKYLFPDSRRGLQYRDPQAADVEGTPFRIECSCGRGNLKRKWLQVLRDGKEFKDERPCLVIKKWDTMEPIVMCDLKWFKTILGIVFDVDKDID